ncbi:MAG TPA: 4-hydroxy-3-methylbut-2-enyl diphosphate reductase [Nitrospiraceae bacterium]|nr:4-hydroxy-3-methylbut-2-enyl diphosphate reductase [Nitrospiraceae bacterium]
MKIYLANPRGFCAGVDRAIDIVDLSLKKYGAPIYVRHEIVHSRHVVNSLRQKGAVFVEELNEVPEGSVVIFSAHGVAKSVWEEAQSRRLHVIDATCPLVIKVHNEVNRDYTQGYELILIGHAGHPEVIGTLGQIPDKFHLVSSVEDVEKLQVGTTNLSYVTQTTLSVDECRDIVGALNRRFPNIKGPHQEDICYATQNRQNAVKTLSKLVDVILVIGSPNSSNSNRLRELGEHCGIRSFLIDSAADINPAWLINARAVGITAGASAPEVLVAEVVAYLKELGSCEEVEDLTVIEEDVEFLLPKELVTIESASRAAAPTS